MQALNDFRERIEKYEEVYETITDRNLHYIKLIDMCATTGENNCTYLLDPLSIGLRCHSAQRHVVYCPDACCNNNSFLGVQGDRAGLHGCEPHQRIHPWQDGLLPHAGALSFSALTLASYHTPSCTQQLLCANSVQLQKHLVGRRSG